LFGYVKFAISLSGIFSGGLSFVGSRWVFVCLILLLAYICVAYAACAATGVKYTVSPAAVKRLGTLLVEISGDLTCDYPEPGGDIKAVAKFSGITVQTTTAKVCGSYKDFSCPHGKGQFTQTASTLVPDNAPYGKYKVLLTETDHAGNVIYNVEVPYEVIR